MYNLRGKGEGKWRDVVKNGGGNKSEQDNIERGGHFLGGRDYNGLGRDSIDPHRGCQGK